MTRHGTRYCTPGLRANSRQSRLPKARRKQRGANACGRRQTRVGLPVAAMGNLHGAAVKVLSTGKSSTRKYANQEGVGVTGCCCTGGDARVISARGVPGPQCGVAGHGSMAGWKARFPAGNACRQRRPGKMAARRVCGRRCRLKKSVQGLAFLRCCFDKMNSAFQGRRSAGRWAFTAACVDAVQLLAC